MENNNCVKALYSYQNANLSGQDIIGHFVVRKNEFDLIISEIRRDDMTGSIQHYILVGRQGSGKSTLLSRIKAEINLDEKLSKKLLVVYLSEEQAGVYRLHDLWDLILRDLNARNIPTDHPQWSAVEEDTASYSRSLYLSIQKALKQKKQKLVLLLDNIDRIFDNIGDDAHLLRELLTNFKDLRIIGGSTRMSEHYWKYDKPFYQFFRIIRLDSLTSNEVRTLLGYWSQCLKLPAVKQFIEKNPGKIETIRVLTDSMPRTLQHFIEILIDRTHQNGFEYLRLILDRASPLYRDRLNYFPPAQRKVVLELSNFWDAVRVSQLIEACKMPGKLVSAQLSQLVGSEVVEKISTGKKDNLYRLSERFFNLWLLMTQGGPREKRQVKYLTVFLEAWYDQAELLALCKEHLESLGSSKLKPDYAALMTTALAHSKFLSVSDRDNIIRKTRSVKESISGYLDFLPLESQEIYRRVNERIESGDLAGARLLLASIEQDDAEKDFTMAYIYYEEKDYPNAEKYYKMAAGKGDVVSLYNLALLYHNSGRNQEAEKYYLQAIDKGHVDALNNLAVLYADSGRTTQAEKYYLQAIEKGVVNALYNLANLYKNSGRNEEAEKYYLQAIDKGHVDALNNLANLYADSGRMDEAEKYFLQAIEKGYVNALYNLAYLYYNSGRMDEAEKYYLQAIEKGYVNALFNLALLYHNSGRIEEAEKYYLQAIDKGQVYALYNLALLYYNLNENKSEALPLLEKYLSRSKDSKGRAFYAVILLWSGDFPRFLDAFNALLPELIVDNNPVLLDALFQDCLVHRQSSLIWQQFTHPTYGDKLKEMLRPLYFVTAGFIPGQEEEALKPGPELGEAIAGIRKYILERQKFYYG
jgi:TPR repeat protein